jgi:hypothetical protein
MDPLDPIQSTTTRRRFDDQDAEIQAGRAYLEELTARIRAAEALAPPKPPKPAKPTKPAPRKYEKERFSKTLRPMPRSRRKMPA